MNDEKMRTILDAMQGMNFLEWQKLAQIVNRSFEIKAGEQKGKIEIASPDEIIADYKSLF